MPKATRKVEIVNVRLPDEVLHMLDQLIEQRLFSSRSEAVREMCRQYIEEDAS